MHILLDDQTIALNNPNGFYIASRNLGQNSAACD